MITILLLKKKKTNEYLVIKIEKPMINNNSLFILLAIIWMKQYIFKLDFLKNQNNFYFILNKLNFTFY